MKPFAIAGHTMGTPGMPVVDALDLFHRAGLDAAEVIWQDGYECGLPEDDLGRTLIEVERRSRELRLPVCCLTPYMTGINSLDDAERQRDLERFRRCLADAERLGCVAIRVYAGSLLAGEDQFASQKWERLVAALRELAPEAGRRGVALAVENHFNTMTVSAADSARLAREVAHESVGILYDQANLAFTHCEGCEQAIPLQAGLIRHVHVKDLVFTDPDRAFAATAVARVSQEERAVRSRVVGDGILDWRSILSALSATGYRGPLGLEYEYRWHPQDLPHPIEGFSRGAAVVREILERVTV